MVALAVFLVTNRQLTAMLLRTVGRWQLKLATSWPNHESKSMKIRGSLLEESREAIKDAFTLETLAMAWRLMEVSIAT